MKHLSGFDKIFETEAWYCSGNMKVLLGHLDWALGITDPHSVVKYAISYHAQSKFYFFKATFIT